LVLQVQLVLLSAAMVVGADHQEVVEGEEQESLVQEEVGEGVGAQEHPQGEGVGAEVGAPRQGRECRNLE
jgi:hypothetical protein